MVILSVHNAYKETGGEDIVFESEAAVLVRHGHEVHAYHEGNASITGFRRFSVGLNAVWSRRSYRAIRDAIRTSACDLVHFHNTFPLISPSAYYAAREEGVPVVQTLHNYRLLCPNALLFREGEPCEACLNRSVPWPGTLHGCYRHSHLSTLSVATMISVHRLLRTWSRMIDLYIAPSHFCRTKYIQAGLDAQKLVVKPGFVLPSLQPGNGEGAYCLFVGRLSEEKGLEGLLEASRSLGPTVPLKIVGDGPLAPLVAKAAQDAPWIEWVGYKRPEEVYELMGRAALLVFPCQAYATFGLVIIEAFAKGTPVIVPRRGALAELVQDGVNGLHYDPNDMSDLRRKIHLALSDHDALESMRQSARAEFEAKYTAEQNYAQMAAIYSELVLRTRNRSGRS